MAGTYEGLSVPLYGEFYRFNASQTQVWYCDDKGQLDVAVTRVAGDTTADNAMSITVTDAGVVGSGYTRGLYVNYTNTGAKTGAAEVNVIGADFDASANVGLASCVNIYTGACTGATINHLAGIYMYLDEAAGTVGTLHGAWIQMDGDGHTLAHFISVQNMASSNIPDSIINSQSTGDCATYFFRMNGSTFPPPAGSQKPFYQGALVDSASAGIACDGYLLIQVSGTSLYIPVFDTAA